MITRFLRRAGVMLTLAASSAVGQVAPMQVGQSVWVKFFASGDTSETQVSRGRAMWKKCGPKMVWGKFYAGLDSAHLTPIGADSLSIPVPCPVPIVAKVTVAPAVITMTVGAQPMPLTVALKDAANATIAGAPTGWQSTNTNVATVSGTGVVRGVAAGTATITALYNGIASNGVTVTVNEQSVVLVATSIQITPSVLSVAEGGSVPISAQILDQFGSPLASSGLVLTWSDNLGSGGSFGSPTSTTNGSGVATVTFAAGPDNAISHRIHAVSGALSGTSSTIDVTLVRVATSIQITPVALTVVEGGTVAISAQILDQLGAAIASSNLVLTWSDNLGSGGSFSAATSTTSASGIATVTFTAGGDDAISHRIHAVSGALSGTSSTIDVVDAGGGGVDTHPNEPAGFTALSPVLSGDIQPPTTGEFAEGSVNDIGWIRQNSVNKVTDLASPVGSTNVLEIPFPAGMGGGGSPGGAFTRGPGLTVNPQNWPLNPRYLYQSYWYKVSSNFPANLVGNKMVYTNIGGGNKVYTDFGGGADYRLVGGENGTVELAPNQATAYTTPLFLIVAIQGVVQVDGIFQPSFNLGQNAISENPLAWHRLFRGQWHHIETLYTANTAGQKDGGVKLWMDGVLLVDFTNRIQWSDTVDNWDWTTWLPVYGGGGQVPNDAVNASHRLKDFYVSGKS